MGQDLRMLGADEWEECLTLKIVAFSVIKNFLFILNSSLLIRVHSQQEQNTFAFQPSPYQ